MSLLIVDMVEFALEHNVYKITDSEIKSVVCMPIEQVIDYAISLGDIDNIQLVGNKEYCNGIKSKLEETLALEYADKNIKIEVVK